MTPAELLRIVSALPAHTPASDRFEGWGASDHRTKPDVWYTSQRQHLRGWLREYNGPGAYGRQGYGGDARSVYQRLQSVGALIWLAEALGEEPRVIEAGIDAVRRAGPRGASQCGAFRKVVPWSRIEELIALR